MKIIENFYRSFFINELFKFKNETGINPTHCIIDSEIYDKLVREIIIILLPSTLKFVILNIFSSLGYTPRNGISGS